jgi:hypothetical protein
MGFFQKYLHFVKKDLAPSLSAISKAQLQWALISFGDEYAEKSDK